MPVQCVNPTRPCKQYFGTIILLSLQLHSHVFFSSSPQQALEIFPFTLFNYLNLKSIKKNIKPNFDKF